MTTNGRYTADIQKQAVQGADGRNSFYYLGTFRFREVDAGESAPVDGGGPGVFNFIYDASASGI
jgi:hypothetical protein